jgi:hypothetical protein
VKTDRFSSARLRAGGLLLAGLLLAPVLSDAGGIHIGNVRIGVDLDSPKHWALALTPQVKEVQKRFADNRRALRALPGVDGKPAYLRKDVQDLIDRTGKDLDEAIVKVQPSNLQPLQDWVADALGHVQGELAPPARETAAFPPGLFAPQAAAVVASLGKPKKQPAKPKAVSPAPVSPAPAPPPPDTVPAAASDSLLDEVGKVIDRIFVLASHNDLEVKLWVGSTAPSTSFSFWSQGQIKGSTLAPATIRTNGKKDHVMRGLYVYKAAHREGAVTEVIEYPNPAGLPATRLPSERLDLVNGTGFFCCRFEEQYCHAVANENECRH